MTTRTMPVAVAEIDRLRAELNGLRRLLAATERAAGKLIAERDEALREMTSERAIGEWLVAEARDAAEMFAQQASDIRAERDEAREDLGAARVNLARADAELLDARGRFAEIRNLTQPF